LKIIFVAPGTLEMPVVKYGGIERVIWNLANGFVQKKYEVKILSKRNETYDDKLNLVFDPYGDNEIVKEKIVNIRENLAHHSKEYLNGVFTYLEENLNSDDVIFLNHSEQKDIRKYLENKRIKFYEIGHYRNFSGDTNIIFPSKMLKNIFFNKSGYIIPHPTDFTEFYNVNEKPLINEDYLLCVGRICKNKRTKVSLDIAYELGLKCVIAGPIHEENYANTFLDKCIYMGNCDSNQLRNLYSNAKVSTCLTNLLPPETFGLFQVEAQACGSTIISSRTGGLQDTFFDNCCVEYSNYKGVKKVCKDFNSMIDSKDLMNKAQISQQAREKFSIEAVVEMYIDKLEL